MAIEQQEPDNEQERPMVVWGELGGVLVFLNKSEGDEQLDFWGALDSSKTVGDLRKHFVESDGVFVDLWEDIWNAPLTWTDEMAAAIEAKEDLEWSDVPDSFPFDPVEFCRRHHDYRGAVGGVELAWFPDDEVRSRCADSGGSMTGGELETFRKGTEDEVIACLEAHGYEVVRDDDYVSGAIG